MKEVFIKDIFYDFSTADDNVIGMTSFQEGEYTKALTEKYIQKSLTTTGSVYDVYNNMIFLRAKNIERIFCREKYNEDYKIKYLSIRFNLNISILKNELLKDINKHDVLEFSGAICKITKTPNGSNLEIFITAKAYYKVSEEKITYASLGLNGDNPYEIERTRIEVRKYLEEQKQEKRNVQAKIFIIFLALVLLVLAYIINR